MVKVKAGILGLDPGKTIGVAYVSRNANEFCGQISYMCSSDIKHIRIYLDSIITCYRPSAIAMETGWGHTLTSQTLLTALKDLVGGLCDKYKIAAYSMTAKQVRQALGMGPVAPTHWIQVHPQLYRQGMTAHMTDATVLAEALADIDDPEQLSFYRQ